MNIEIIAVARGSRGGRLAVKSKPCFPKPGFFGSALAFFANKQASASGPPRIAEVAKKCRRVERSMERYRVIAFQGLRSLGTVRNEAMPGQWKSCPSVNVQKLIRTQHRLTGARQCHAVRGLGRQLAVA